MTTSGEREEPMLQRDDTRISYHQQFLELLHQILEKLNDIHEELANQPAIFINEDISEGSEDSFISHN